MKTPYLVAKGAKEAHAKLNEALAQLGEIEAPILEICSTRQNTLKEPLNDLFSKLAEVNEWLHAIMESRG